MDLPPITNLGEADADIAPLRSLDAVETEGAADEQSGAGTSAEGDGSDEAGSEQGSADSGLPQPAGSARDAAAEPAGDAAEAGAEDGEQPDRPQLEAAVRARAEQWEALEQAFARDPAGLVASIAGSLTLEQRQALGMAPEAPPAGFREDAELSPEERFVKHRAAPALAALPGYQRQVSGAFQQHAAALSDLLAVPAAERPVALLEPVGQVGERLLRGDRDLDARSVEEAARQARPASELANSPTTSQKRSGSS